MIDAESNDKDKAALIYEFRKDVINLPYIKRQEYISILRRVMSVSDAFTIEVYEELINYIK